MKTITTRTVARYQNAMKNAQKFADTFGIDSIEALRAQRRARSQLHHINRADMDNRLAQREQVQS